MIGEKIHHYQVTRLIGEGGMASVYEAVHEKLQSKVAIKVLNPVLTANHNIRQRFENEARFMASLTHANITRVIDYEERPGLLAIVMELLEGEDLNARTRRKGAMTLEEAVAVFIQVLDAFDYAHQKGIVHRDVKPSNIFIEPSGTVKILDFGIAKLLSTGEDMTMTGTQMGTPVYMSPEQVNTDKTLDHRSDIYSLGVTLYYLLKGEPPYDVTTNSSFQIYTRIVQEPLPPLGVYPEMDIVIGKATHKDRNLRYQSCREFKAVLLENTQQQKKPQHRSAPAVDMEKTLIDTPQPRPEVEKKPEQSKKPEPAETEKKPERKPVPTRKDENTSGTGNRSRIKFIALTGVGILIVAAVVMYALQPDLFIKIFNPAELQRRREEASQYLEKAKAEYNKTFAAQNFDTAVFYLKKAASLDQENPEIFYFLSDALYHTVSKDGLDLTGLNYNTIAEASTAIETTIKLNPAYTNEFRNYDIHSRLTIWWGELALHYLASGDRDSALIALSEGKKRGAFNDVVLELARNTMNSCDENSLLFQYYDITFYPLLYLQTIENLRTDIKPIHVGLLETSWYFSYLKNRLMIPASFGEVWFALLLEKPWEVKLMSIDNVNTNQQFTWWLWPDNEGKLTVRSQVMVDIITSNKFSNPVCFNLAFDNRFMLSLGSNLHPEGIVYKLKTEAANKRSLIHQTRLQQLNFPAVQNSSIPSFELRAMLDFVRNEYLSLINHLYDNGDQASAIIFKNQLEKNIPLANYPFYYKEVDNYYLSTIAKISFTDDQRREKEKSDIAEYLQKNNLSGTPTPSGLYYIEQKAGSGVKAQPGKTVKVHYTGTLLNGTKFDSSFDRSEPFTFKLGSGQVINGWEEGIALMRAGSKGLLIIPYDLGYGARGAGTLISAYSTLVFEVELLEVN